MSIVMQHDDTPSLTVSNNTISIRRASFSENVASYGGALYVHIASSKETAASANRVSLTDCTFSLNHVMYDTLQTRGGAIYVDIDEAEHPTEITLSRCTFEENYSGLRTTGPRDALGGAVAIRSHSSRGTSLLIDDCTFTDNSVMSGSGGALYMEFNTTQETVVALRQSKFHKNAIENLLHASSNARGGALALILERSNGATINIDHVDFMENLVRAPSCIEGEYSCGGGAIWAYVDADLNTESAISNCNFNRNKVNGKGFLCSTLHREAQSGTSLRVELETCNIADGVSEGTCPDPGVSCYGKDPAQNDVCSGHGSCEDYNRCNCVDPWGAKECEIFTCSKGHYFDDSAGCVECPGGTYDNRTELHEPSGCVLCPPGSYSQAIGAYSPEVCQRCEPQTIASQPGSTECEKCRGVFRTANHDRTECITDSATIGLVFGSLSGCLIMVSVVLLLAIIFVVRRRRSRCKQHIEQSMEEQKPLIM